MYQRTKVQKCNTTQVPMYLSTNSKLKEIRAIQTNQGNLNQSGHSKPIRVFRAI